MTVKRYDIAEMSGNPWESYRCIEEEEDGDYVRYEDYAALKAELDAARGQVVSLAVENSAFKSAINQFDNWPGIEFHSSAWEFNNCDGHEAGEALNVESPATDAAIANLQAQGVEKFAEFCRLKGEVRAFNFFNDAALNAEEFAVNLRKGSTDEQ